MLQSSKALNPIITTESSGIMNLKKVYNMDDFVYVVFHLLDCERIKSPPCVMTGIFFISLQIDKTMTE